jgi:hypothetical protein
MLFLIVYDRSAGQILSLSSHPSDARRHVDEERFGWELRLRRESARHEVVVLEADSEEALRRTHARYFKTAGALVPAAPTFTS